VSSEEVRLDGNAAAGVLSEAFAVEMTSAVGTCAGCGARAAFGTTLVYMGGPGTVLRCSSCEAVLMRFARMNGRLNVELRGLRRVELPPGG
jgi:hypothetical protein